MLVRPCYRGLGFSSERPSVGTEAPKLYQGEAGLRCLHAGDGDDGVSCQLRQEGSWPGGPHHHGEGLKCCREKTNSGWKPKVTAESLPPGEVAETTLAGE